MSSAVGTPAAAAGKLEADGKGAAAPAPAQSQPAAPSFGQAFRAVCSRLTPTNYNMASAGKDQGS